MAYYQYYQSGGPWQQTWGTNAYQFQAPPMPTYVPQSTWSGMDFYNAHYGGQSDSSLFDYVWSKVRNVVTGPSVSRGEAEHWHRRVYGGFVQMQQLMPRDIGAAAGWETVRLWQSHRSFYSNPLSGEREREREAIVGLAIAEAARLWQYVGRPLDKYGRREAGEVAAATASRIFMQMYGYDSPYEPYRSGRYGGGDFNDYYSDDDDYPYNSRRRGSISNYGGSMYGGSSYGSVTPYAGSSPIAIPGSAQSVYGGMPGYGGSPGGYGGNVYGTPYYGNSTSYLSASPYQTMGAGLSAPGYGMQQMVQQPGLLTASPGQVIIHTDSRRHRHRSGSSHRHHHHRSRSNSSIGGGYAYSANGSYV